MPAARFDAVVIGTSAGGMQALKTILPALPASFSLPVIIVQHVNERSDNFIVDYLNGLCALHVKEAEEKESAVAGTAYFAAPGYHLLLERDRSFSFSVDPRVNYTCPSIDVLFESAAEAIGENLIGIVLTGGNADGAQGLKKIKHCGGLAIVQNPLSAQAATMPQAALDAVAVDYVAEVEQIAPLLLDLASSGKEERYATSIAYL